VAANVVFFAVMFVVMVGWAVRQVVSVEQLDQPYPVAAEFSNAFGILPNAEVTYLGVGYGTVSGVARAPGGVRIDMKIEQGRRIPEQATAMITRKSAVGEPYVDFSPPTGASSDGGPYLEAGDIVPIERTRVPLEFSELLRSASGVIGSIPPADLHTLVHELAVGLEGRSGDLRRLAESGDDLAATFAAQTELLDRLTVNNTRLTHVVTEHRDDLASSVASLRLLAQTLDATKGDTSLLLDRGSVLLTQIADLVAAEKGNLDCDLKVLELLIDETSTPRRLAELRAVLDIAPRAFAGLYDSIDIEADGPWIRVGNVSNGTNSPAQYVPPRTLPPARQVGACASQLRAVSSLSAPAGGDYRPGQGAAGSALPATGAAGAATGGGVLIAAWAVTARVRRHGRRRLRSAA
jgi:phospholipid/cholesterol/gamma-HCH transport system substrate-binding protein